jgi:hypothetical protein
VEFRVYSQWGEDGILEWLIQRLQIPSSRFVEFGVGDYSEANTRLVLINRNWKGLVIDGSVTFMERLRREDIHWRHDLTAVSAFIDRDNINELITSSGFSGQLGILSIDIDGNDYWVWDALTCVNPMIVVCEYNAVFGDKLPVTVPYGACFDRTRAHFSNLYYGASIGALELLARRKGYELIGSNSAGNNAFFLRHDLFPFVSQSITSRASFPSRFRESKDAEGQLTFQSGIDRLRQLNGMPVTNVATGQTFELGAAETFYSPKWLASE